MRCAPVFYLVATIFGIVYNSVQLCVIKDYGVRIAFCARDDIKNTFDFIPPISQNITYIDLEGQPLKQLPYNAFRNVSNQRSMYKVSLRRCQISHVDPGALLNLHKLMNIHMSYNNITQLDGKLFRDTKQLTYIYLDHNQIEVVPSGLFQDLVLLVRIDLHENRIHQVERFSFKNTPSLWTIDLGDNQIEFMDMSSFKDTFDNLTNLWLNDNPWKCDCELGPLYEFVITIDYLNQPGLICDKPPTLHGRHWEDIGRDKFVCSSEDAPSTRFSSTSSEIRKTESSDKPVTRRKPEIRKEISDSIQRPVIIDEKQDVAVEEETNSSEISELVTAESDTEAEESSKTPQEPVDDQIVSSTTAISFDNHEGADTNVQTVSSDLKWLPWTLLSVVVVCLLGCAARYTFTRYRRRRIPSVRRTEQPTEETSELLYFQTAEQANC